jgi:pyruvate formate lyase activating enzyme
VRIPLIPGINDDEKNLLESGKFIASLSYIQSVELMGYHDIAQAKYVALGREYALTATKPTAETKINQAAELLRNYGLNVVIR